MKDNRIIRQRPFAYSLERKVTVEYAYKVEKWPAYFFGVFCVPISFLMLFEGLYLGGILGLTLFGMMLGVTVRNVKNRSDNIAYEFAKEGLWINKSKTFVPWSLIKDIRQSDSGAWVGGMYCKYDFFILHAHTLEKDRFFYKQYGFPTNWFARKIDNHTFLMKINLMYTQGRIGLSVSKEELWKMLHEYSGVPLSDPL